MKKLELQTLFNANNIMSDSSRAWAGLQERRNGASPWNEEVKPFLGRHFWLCVIFRLFLVISSFDKHVFPEIRLSVTGICH